MSVLLATAGLAEVSEADQRQFEFALFIFSALPSVAYFLATTSWWLVANRRILRNRQVSLRSLFILVAVLCPGLVLVRLVVWPYWWYS